VRTTTRPQVERLESRELLSADWFSTYLPNASVAKMARTDWNGHGAITYSDMLAIYTQVERDGVVDKGEFSSLQSLASSGSSLRTPAPVRYLEAQVIGNNAANRYYQSRSLGNLAVGSSAAHLQKLVGKWFLGQDLPMVESGQGIVYSPVKGTLFGSGGPVYTDISQGGAGDCVLLSSLAVTAAHDKAAIQGMFTSVGNNVWIVRFYANGSPVYVTVNNYLPTVRGQTYYDHPLNGVLWAALAEKAYAELNAFDGQTGYDSSLQWQNTYTTGDAGLDPGCTLAALTGLRNYSGNGSSTVSQAVKRGNLVVLGTGSNTGSKYIVSNHEYALISYNASTQMATLFNPWGIASLKQSGVWGTVNVSLSYLETYFSADTGWAHTAAAHLGDGSLPALEATEKLAFAPAAAGHVAHVDAVFATYRAGEAASVGAHDLRAVLSGHRRHTPAEEGAVASLLA
jgi:hypothetical protein